MSMNKGSGVKQVIVVRGDLGLSAGELCGHVANASHDWLTSKLDYDYHGDYASVSGTILGSQLEWLDEGSPVEVVCTDTGHQLEELARQARSHKLPTHLQYDVLRGIVCIAIGPESSEVINTITGHLPML